MARQEEVKELTRIDEVLIGYASAVAEVEEKELMTHSMVRREWGRLLVKVKQDLSNLGVAIKVDRGLPENCWKDEATGITYTGITYTRIDGMRTQVKEPDLVAVESLIRRD